MATATIPTAKAIWFSSKLRGKGPLFPLGEGEKGEDFYKEVTIKDDNGKEKKIKKQFRIRAETIADLLEAAEDEGLDKRVAEIKAELPKFLRTYGTTPPEIGTTRRYATNKAGYVQVNTKIIQAIDETTLVRERKIEEGKPNDYTDERRRTHPIDPNTKKPAVKRDGSPAYNDNYSTYVDITYEEDKIIIRVAPERHRLKIAEASPPKKTRGRPKKKA